MGQVIRFIRSGAMRFARLGFVRDSSYGLMAAIGDPEMCGYWPVICFD